MFGCESCRVIRTSAKNRSRHTGSVDIWRGRNFSATVCPSFMSSARYTSPMPPRPSSPTMRYRPRSTLPGVSPPTGIDSEERRLTPRATTPGDVGRSDGDSGIEGMAGILDDLLRVGAPARRVLIEVRRQEFVHVAVCSCDALRILEERFDGD